MKKIEVALDAISQGKTVSHEETVITYMKNKIIILACFLLTVGYNAYVLPQENTNNKQEEITDEYLIRLWRVEKVAIEDIDKHYCRTHPGCEAKKDFRISASREWKEFIPKYQKGDELWFYTSPPETWEKLMGNQGYAIFRNDKVVAEITTLLN